MSAFGWIGFDLDGTLAKYSGDVSVIGEPIEEACDIARRYIKEGWTVKIVTARVSARFIEPDSIRSLIWSAADHGEINRVLKPHEWEAFEFAKKQTQLIQEWCAKHLGKQLEVTALKDFTMIALFDDRAIAVEPMTGKILGGELPGVTP